MTPPSASLSERLTALAQRLGLSGRAARHILERASQLRLPFEPLAQPPESIWWEDGQPLHRLADLPRDALSGPVQDDKQAARSALLGLVRCQTRALPSLDLRQVDGLPGFDPRIPCTRFEDFVAALPQRRVRIIGYKDYLKALALALPRLGEGQPVGLRRADWRGSRLFWAGEQSGEAFASAIAYARFRDLTLLAPAELAEYAVDPEALERLDTRYHILEMPNRTWADGDFMGLLVETAIPYARLSLSRRAGAPEWLLLPKGDPDATALGAGLRVAGAPDVVAYLRGLATPRSRG